MVARLHQRACLALRCSAHLADHRDQSCLVVQACLLAWRARLHGMQARMLWCGAVRCGRHEEMCGGETSGNSQPGKRAHCTVVLQAVTLYHSLYCLYCYDKCVRLRDMFDLCDL